MRHPSGIGLNNSSAFFSLELWIRKFHSLGVLFCHLNRHVPTQGGLGSLSTCPFSPNIIFYGLGLSHTNSYMARAPFFLTSGRGAKGMIPCLFDFACHCIRRKGNTEYSDQFLLIYADCFAGGFLFCKNPNFTSTADTFPHKFSLPKVKERYWVLSSWSSFLVVFGHKTSAKYTATGSIKLLAVHSCMLVHL